MTNRPTRQEYTDLCSLLRGFVHGEVPTLSGEPDWKEIFALARIHGLIGIVGWMITRYSLTDDEDLKVLSKRIAKETVALYVRRWEDTRCLLKGLGDQGIDHLLFKGYVVRDCYPMPELRTYGDMDLAIHPEDRKRVHTWMQEQGYETGTDWEPVYSYHRGMELYEFHTDIMEVNVTDCADYRGYFRTVWDHAVKREGHTYVPDNDYHFLYLLTHIAKHISASGAGLRMYLDLALFIKTFGEIMDWDWIAHELEVIRLTDFAATAMTAVRQWFGVSCPMEVKEAPGEVMEEFLAFTMEGGTFGHQDRDAGVISLKREERNGSGPVSRTATLLHRLFPRAETIERRYTYLQGRHWLLPAAWIHRFFRTHQTWGAHAKEARTIVTADEEEVRRLRKISSDIGLG